MDDVKDYDLHVLWDKKKTLGLFIGFAVVNVVSYTITTFAGMAMMKKMMDNSIPVAVPQDAEFPHPDSPSFGR